MPRIQNFDKPPTKKSCTVLHKPRFLIDENISPTLKNNLKAKNCNVLHAADLNLCGKPDTQVYQTALQHKRIILTYDNDFLNNRSFPIDARSGVFILLGAEGNTSKLQMSVNFICTYVNPWIDTFYGTKCTFYPNQEVKITQREHNGKITTKKYFVAHGTHIWKVNNNEFKISY